MLVAGIVGAGNFPITLIDAETGNELTNCIAVRVGEVRERRFERLQGNDVEALIVTNGVCVMTMLGVLGLAPLAQAQTFTVIYNLTGTGGGLPWAGVIQDASGRLYGTTGYGGGNDDCSNYGCGVVYELDTAGAETVLHAFSGSDGQDPAAPVTRDGGGNLYGTTVFGGSAGAGTVFKIDAAGNETVLYNFTGQSDGCYPIQGLVRDKSGNLYGTTNECGSSGYGTIFKVDSAGDFTALHSFAGSDGANPQYGHLAKDKSGNLYGLSIVGGGGHGVLYRLSTGGRLTLLHSFTGGTSDGCYPSGSVVQDEAGNFYGTTNRCGSYNQGTIWKVSKKGKETILHSFAGGTSDGCNPGAGVTRGSKGNLYGVTYYCGAQGGGALYELSAKGSLTLLQSFYGSFGAYPFGEVLRTTKGTLFGTAYEGGTYDAGTVWSYVP